MCVSSFIKVVSRVFQWSLKRDSRIFQGNIKGVSKMFQVSRVFQECFMGIQRRFKGVLRLIEEGALMLFQVCIKSVSRRFQISSREFEECFLCVSWGFQGYSKEIQDCFNDVRKEVSKVIQSSFYVVSGKLERVCQESFWSVLKTFDRWFHGVSDKLHGHFLSVSRICKERFKSLSRKHCFVILLSIIHGRIFDNTE